ncbi:MAG: aminoacyl-tRNA hydrolase [Odoribacter sp.]
MKYLIVGLGNIGPEYQDTRHNIGFNVLDAFAKASNAVFEDKRYGAVCEVKIKGRTLVLLKPNTYMNLSGKAVNYWMQKEKIAVEDLLVIVDDLALPFGTLRLKGQGSDGGHNGLKNINALLGTTAYARLRYGIGNNFLKGGQIDYVLGTWNEREGHNCRLYWKRGGEIITNFVVQGIARTMNIFNTTKK